jgi:anti-anti-sigma factor
VRVVGEVDMSTAALFEDHVAAAVRASTPVVLDLREVTFLGSSGLSVLIRQQERCGEMGAVLRIVADQREVLRTLQIAGLTDTFALYPSVELALAERDTTR